MATSAKQWKKDKGPVDLEVPSGNIAKVRKVDMSVFLEKGILPNSLKPVIEKIFQEGEKGKAPSMEEAGLGIDDFDSLKEMVDAVVLKVVLEPKVLPVPKGDDEERDPETLYVDEVDFEDKMFIFNWAVGGPADLKQFRNGQASNVGPVPSGEDVEHEAVTTP